MTISFRLSGEFLDGYKERPVDWGYKIAGGSSLGEIIFLRTYSRLKEDGTKERWWEVCQRVIEGMFSIQKDHCKSNRLPWNDNKAQRSAQEAYERLFTFKWTPPGRGLWMMGTPLVMEQRNSAALQNCAFISTSEMTRLDPSYPFRFLMEASMLGIGVGFDDKGAEKDFIIQKPIPPASEFYTPYIISDDREGWVESVGLLIDSYLMPNKDKVFFDYRLIREQGEPIKTFGGVAAGPEPLKRLHRLVRSVFEGREGQRLTETDIADLGNMIGQCVVAGNVRRSAELLMGSIDNKDFLNLKNYEVNPIRNHWCDDKTPEHECPGKGWGHLSNNSVAVEVGQDYTNIIEGIKRNGEPGVIWMDTSRTRGRLIDPPNNKDYRVAGYNPCGEQSLESGECCTLVETYLNKHESVEDYKRTLKFAYMYAKTVTLLPTHWPKTNAIMQRNRRVGTSMAGIANFADRRNLSELKTWMNEGYDAIQYYDKKYSEWLAIRESVKTTTVKPGGTTPILAGESPGAHWGPGGTFFHRLIRFDTLDPIVRLCSLAGFRVEPDVSEPETRSVVYFPVKSNAARSEKEVTIFEKANLAITAQRYWSDNSVSVTLSFDPVTEGQHIGTILHMHEGQLKTVSFLPQGNDVYPQMPYQEITESEYEDAELRLFKIDLEPLYNGLGVDAVGEKYCSTDKCVVL